MTSAPSVSTPADRGGTTALLYASALGTLQLGRVAMSVAEEAPGVPRISRITADQVRAHVVATALAHATGAGTSA